MLLRAVSALLLSAATLSCDRTHNTTVEFYSEDGYRFSQGAAGKTAAEFANVPTSEVLRLAGFD